MRDILTAPVLLIGLALPVAAAGCGETVGSPTPTTAPTATIDAGVGTPAATPAAEIPQLIAPFELAAVHWPTEPAETAPVIEAMPATISDFELEPPTDQTDPTRVVIEYASAESDDFMRLAVLDLTTGEFFPPNWTPYDVVAHQIVSEDTREAGREEDVVWSFIMTAENDTDLFGLLWGAADSAVIFNAAATTEELLQDLVDATVAAARGAEEEVE